MIVIVSTQTRRSLVERALERNNGILQLEPAWVMSDYLPPGRRLGLKESEYEVGERGWITERWLASTTQVDCERRLPDEGLSYIKTEDDECMTLKEAVEVGGDLIMGEDYARAHKTLGRLAKIYDYGIRLPCHLHQMKEHAALVGRNPKEEAYYFPEGVDMGPHPEGFFGVHPYIAAQRNYDILLPYLMDWNSDLILQHTRGYVNVPGDGFHLPAGVPHAPGTALTIELQEDSDVAAIMQALIAGKIISKDLLFKDVRPQDRHSRGERIILDQINWEVSGDPFFYENRHTPPVLIEESRQPGGEEYWIYYNSSRFSGKKLIVKPGLSFTGVDNGVYSVLVWRGKGRYDGHEISAGCPGSDELLVSHENATKPIVVENTGREDLVLIKFFGPDINPDAPVLDKVGTV